MTAANQPMNHWVQSFIEAQAAELDAATNTQLAYARDLADFADWLEPKGLHFATATQDDAEGYLIDCEAQGLAKSTRARRLSAIKQLYRFAFEEGWRDDWEDSNNVPGLVEITLCSQPEDRYADPVEFRKLIEIPLGCLSLNQH